MNDQPIAVFDSGLGGLTVVRALRRALPQEEIVYFGDTARVPYGTKSSRTVQTFAEQDCHFLLRFDPKLIVVACNTASALALDHLSKQVAVPILGVVEPGAAAAVESAAGGRIAVLATEATVASEAYVRAIHALSPRTPVTQKACPSLVAFVEEGRAGDDPLMRLLLSEYLEAVKPLLPAVVLLGCTHYPLVAEAIAGLVPDAAVVDSAEATAADAKRLLASQGGLSPASGRGRLRCYVSDNPSRFREVGARFLGTSDAGIRDVTWITPEQFFDESIVPTAGDYLGD